MGDEALTDAVCGYARRLHAAMGERHHVASPLGAWLVLALTADAARDDAADRLAAALGMPGADAARLARVLLDDPHPAVATAAAAWTSAPVAGPAARWRGGLPAAVATGPVPDQAGADAWAREHTSGLIGTFPIELTPSTVAVLVGAVAATVTWLRPFDTADAGGFRSAWRDRVDTVLRTPPEGRGCAVVGHPRAGDLAVHHAHADGLRVTSVVAGPDVAPGTVLDAAHDVVRDRVRRISLFDLPLGDGPSWTVTESPGVEGRERFTALLPAWSARSRHDLREEDLGFPAAAAVLGRLFPSTHWEAVHAAAARFHQRGFEAAAVTAVARLISRRVERPGPQRDAELRFDRPYAVVATATGNCPEPWRGLPVFSAWVADPEDATGPAEPPRR